jgi:hypothetical protein
VTIAGYSPYKDIGALMEPIGVENDPNKWGVVTRLLHLSDIVGEKNPFELYERAKPSHFKLEYGEVALGANMPAGIGLDDTQKDESVLVDPMTKEVISKVAALNPDGSKKIDRSGKTVYESNDHWFKLNIKFLWKDASNNEATEAKTETST